MTTDNVSPALARLEDQNDWYERKSGYNQRMFKVLKLWTILVAALVPVLAAVGMSDPKILASLTATIAVVEAIQQLNQYQTNWIAYRATSEALKREKYLYLCSAGAYSGAANPNVILAERVEALVSQEHSKWTTNQEQSAKAGSAGS